MGLVEGLHRRIVPHLRKSRNRFARDALRGRRAGAELGIFTLQPQQLFIEKVIVAVADDWPRLNIVEPVVPLDLGTKKLDALLYLNPFHHKTVLIIAQSF